METELNRTNLNDNNIPTIKRIKNNVVSKNVTTSITC